jgi:dCTP diphosphatase
MSRLQVAQLQDSSRPNGRLDSLEEIQARLNIFRRERAWEAFHSPKNLAVSVAIEAGELLEHFQWRSDAEVAQHIATDTEAIAEEIADVAIYAIQLADVAGIDLGEALAAKIEKNRVKYPPESTRGVGERRS